jgi:hypothetical protein
LGFAILGCQPTSGGVGPVPENCPDVGGTRLDVGQTAEFSGASARTLCIDAAAVGEEFVLIASSLALDGTTDLRVEGHNAASVLGPPSPDLGPVDPIFELDWAAASDGMHAQLRAREMTELRVDAGVPWPTVGPSAAAMAVLAPVPGQLMTLNAQAEYACSNPLPVVGRVEAVSQTAVVVADTQNPPGGFTRNDYEHFAASFDTLITPVIEANFGSPSDLDGNGRTILFFTKEVNALEGDEESFTSGFFFSRDLFPASGPGIPLSNCSTSNEAEMVYMLVPDPSGAFGTPIDRDEVSRFTLTNLGHEAQHLVNAAERLYGHPSGPVELEATWLNEGLSHVAEELLFYEVSGLGPKMDIGLDDLHGSAIDAINDYQLLNYIRLRFFYLDPAGNSPFSAGDALATRGSAWSFLRYASDRSPASDASFFKGLVGSSARGFANLAGVVGGESTAFRWLGDWSVGLYADNRVPGTPSQFQDASWDNPSIFQGADFDPPYIQTGSLGPSPVLTETLVGGGTAYFRFAATGARVTRISITSGNAAPPPTLRATILRTR